MGLSVKRLSLKRVLLNIILIMVIIISPLTVSTAIAADGSAEKTGNAGNVNKGVQVKNPATDLWRAVRQRDFKGADSFTTTSQIPSASPFINEEGNKWRQLRREKLLPYSGYFILGVLGFLLLLMILIKRVKIPNGRSGELIARMSVMQRISHWLMAILVIIMAITGLLVLFGRVAIIPFMGAKAFSPIASFSIDTHNVLGPVVIFSLVLMLIYFIRYNFPSRGDFKWLMTLGGLLSKKHLEIGFFNAGEKTLYWATIFLGITLSVTGLLLMFPEYQPQLKLNSQLALILHLISAMLLIALVLAHIWMVRTVEGTLEAITKGKVDENWAKSHHSIWYKKAMEKTNKS